MIDLAGGRLRPLLASLLSLSLACATSDAVELHEVSVSEEGELGKADGASELKVRAGETSVWMRSALELRGQQPTLVLRGRTSRNLDGGHAFVMDDIYGDFAAPSPRTFEVTWPLSYARMLLDGVDLFVGFDFVHSSSRPDSLTTHVVVRPRLGSFAGSSQIYVVAALTPVIVAGRTVYRLRGSTQADMFSADAHAGELALGAARVVDARHFELDLEPEVALARIADRQPITFRVQLESGFVEKTAVLGIAIGELGITTGDAYEEWPHHCTDELRGCLESQPAGTLDLASCGDAFELLACRGQVGLLVDDAQITARVAALEPRIATLGTDAAALVGADRADDFVGRAQSSIVADLEHTGGRWFLDAQGRDAALDAVTEASFDRTYAFPLAGFAARPAAPGEEAATRQLVADALLGYLAEQDYVHSEFGRSYVELAHEFRSQHVASLRAFRETVAREDYPGMPALDVYVADWLGAYTEVAVDKMSGAVSRVYVELD